MALLQQIQEDLKSAMKEKKEKELSALRMLVSSIKNEEIAKRPAELKEEDIAVVIKREVKKLKDAVLDFRKGGREDLAGDYEEQAKIFGRYLPEEMGEEELRRIITEVISSAEDKNFGLLMRTVKEKTGGRADGATASRILKEEMGK